MLYKNAERQNINGIGMFDLGKGVLTALVILRHTIFLYYDYAKIGKEISLFTIPVLFMNILFFGTISMFFIMSGYGFRKQKMKKCINDRIHYLLKPYLFVAASTTMVAVTKKIIVKGSLLDPLKFHGLPFLLGLCPGKTKVFGLDTASIGPMWFLVALALGWIFLNWLFTIENEVVRLICIVSIIAFVTQLPFMSFVPFCYLQSLSCIGYLYIGYHIKKKHLLTYKFTTQAYIILVLIVVCSLLFGKIEVSQNQWKLGFYDYIVSCIVGFFMIRAFLMLERYDGKILQVFRTFGKDSLLILCVHTVEYLTFPWEKIVDKITTNELLSIVLIVVCRCIIIGVVCFIIKKINRLCHKKKV